MAMLSGGGQAAHQADHDRITRSTHGLFGASTGQQLSQANAERPATVGGDLGQARPLERNGHLAQSIGPAPARVDLTRVNDHPGYQQGDDSPLLRSCEGRVMAPTPGMTSSGQPARPYARPIRATWRQRAQVGRVHDGHHGRPGQHRIGVVLNPGCRQVQRHGAPAVLPAQRLTDRDAIRQRDGSRGLRSVCCRACRGRSLPPTAAARTATRSR